MTVARRTIFFALFPFACGYFLSYLLRAVNAVVAPNLVQDFGVSPADLISLPAPSTTAKAPVWRLSTMPPRVTSAMTGLFIIHDLNTMFAKPG